MMRTSLFAVTSSNLDYPLSDPIEAAVPAVDVDIMSRRMPPMGPHGHSKSYDVRVTKRKLEGADVISAEAGGRHPGASERAGPVPVPLYKPLLRTADGADC